ncbi:hypothetical protein FSC37_15700 [Piscinibacter aquaticus]|uniref:Uncharacterized protein n=1 Tax=Piscinibacter aquaticus TaxID=392597 RepID=A0A5C6U4W2_9BURK|nr:hypothetical protein FSC37_15700 [Piscinibacter aquaticus]
MRREGLLRELGIGRQRGDLRLQLGPAGLQAGEFLAHVEVRLRGGHVPLDGGEHAIHLGRPALEGVQRRGIARRAGDGDAAALDQHLVPLDQVGHQRSGRALGLDAAHAGVEGAGGAEAQREQQQQGRDARQQELVSQSQA